MIQRRQKIMIRFIPYDINALVIHGRSGGGIAIELVPRKGHECEITFPFHFPITRAQAKHRQTAGSVAGASDENPRTPKNRRGMAAPRQFNFPIDVRICDFSWEVFGVTDAAAVRAAKTGPFLGREVENQDQQ